MHRRAAGVNVAAAFLELKFKFFPINEDESLRSDAEDPGPGSGLRTMVLLGGLDQQRRHPSKLRSKPPTSHLTKISLKPRKRSSRVGFFFSPRVEI